MGLRAVGSDHFVGLDFSPVQPMEEHGVTYSAMQWRDKLRYHNTGKAWILRSLTLPQDDDSSRIPFHFPFA